MYQLLADWVWREEILDFNGHDGTEGQKSDFLGTRARPRRRA
jgi:hypothetical protein